MKTQLLKISWPIYFLYLFFPFILANQVKRILLQEKIDRVILPMPTPLDSKIIRTIRKKGIQVVSVVHDAKRHPGEFWPMKHDIHRILRNSDSIVAMSNYVKEQVIQIYGIKEKITVVPHPNFDFKNYQGFQNRQKDYFLFVGRIRKYKGLQLLINAWQNLVLEEELLVIAGEGNLGFKPSKLQNSEIQNVWLTDEEISVLIQDARVVIFPYLESSQSGILPFAISQNKMVLLSDLQGLREQVGNYMNAIFFESGNQKSLEQSLTKIINGEIQRNYETPVNTLTSNDAWEALSKALKKI